jgi:hypothetical protein
MTLHGETFELVLDPFGRPSTRIHTMKHGKAELEDHLYDQGIDDPFGRGALITLTLFARRSGTAKPSKTSQIFDASTPPEAPESDPSKADPHDLGDEEEKSRDIPGDELHKQPQVERRR